MALTRNGALQASNEVGLAPEPNQGYLHLRALYGRLSAGPWRCQDHHGFEDALLLEIWDAVSPNSIVADTGIASALRHGLIAGGFLTARRLDDQWTEFVKATECPDPDTRTWEEAQNEHLRTLQAAEKRMLDEEYENRERVGREERELHEAPERAQLARHLQELGVVTREELAGIVEAAVEAALARREAAV
jgi:hypothetical protein